MSSRDNELLASLDYEEDDNDPDYVDEEQEDVDMVIEQDDDDDDDEEQDDGAGETTTISLSELLQSTGLITWPYLTSLTLLQLLALPPSPAGAG